MLDSLPARPLTPQEVDALSETETLELAFPATPESIRETDEGQQRIYDLLLFLGETVVAVAYGEDQGAWTVVTRETDENDDAYEVAYDELLAYRGYEAIDREEAMKRAITKLYGLPEELAETELEELESLEDGG